MQVSRSRFMLYPLCAAFQLIAVGFSWAESSQEGPIEEVLKSEPVGTNQILLRAIYREPRGVLATAWTPIASARSSTPTILEFEIRDKRERGYLLKYSLACSDPDFLCQFSWKSATLDLLHLRPDDLWVLARQKGDPIQFRYVPICLCSASNVARSSAVHMVFVPTRSINLRYVIKTEIGEEIMSGSFERLPAGRPIEVSIASAKAKPPTVLRVRLDHVAIDEGELERFTDTFDIIWAL